MLNTLAETLFSSKPYLGVFDQAWWNEKVERAAMSVKTASAIAYARLRQRPGEGTMIVVGYARVSKREQNPKAQEAELKAAGAKHVFIDHDDSSRVKDHPQWVACVDCWCAGWIGSAAPSES